MNDKDGITRNVLDYVEGWYQGDAKRMDQALSKHLAKRRIASDEEIIDLSKEWMLTETGNGRGRIENPEQGRKDITILAQTETMASVSLLSENFVDYLHLVKVGDFWKIANVLWDYLPKEGTPMQHSKEPAPIYTVTEVRQRHGQRVD